MPRTGHGPASIRNKKHHRFAEERARREHSGYLEAPSTLLKSYEAGLARIRRRLAEQREKLQRARRNK
jgi:hypothetical protein